MTIDVTTARIGLLTELEALAAAITQASASAGTVELDQSKVGRVSRIDADLAAVFCRECADARES